MKSYKIKSLIYFSLFAIVAVIYNNIEQEEKFSNQITSNEVVDINLDELEDIESDKTKAPLK